ncbi:1-acylglycerol-3-phosphate O [Cytidiella melzeri]|nr:1-acylglycerol-3-phosphate O [Cytidiella melzeri]
MSVFGLIKSLVYISLPVFALHTLSKSSPIIRYYVRATMYLSTLGAASIWGAIVSVGMNVVGDRYDVNWVVARSFYAVASRVMDIKLELEGGEYLETRPAILVGNHQSMLDILYLGRVMPRRSSIMAKKELQWSPLLGQFMTLAGAVFVDRGNNAKAVRSLQAAAQTIKTRNTSLWMFPEGTRSMREENDMLPFKKGAFHMAVEAGVPIVPVVCENYWRLYRKGVFNTGTLKIKGLSRNMPPVLPPVPTAGLAASDVAALAVRVREMMVEALREISVPVPSTGSGKKPAGDITVPPPSSSPAEKSAPVADDALTHILPSVTEAGPDASATLSRSESRASTNFSEEQSSPTLSRHGLEGSETGVETEEDEGMVLVGRPTV